MQPGDRDPAYLRHMREAAWDVIEFVRGVTYSRFAEDKVLRYAVERRLEMLGEAARQVSESFKRAHGEIPWRQLDGLRAMLVRGQGEIPVERLWMVATESAPGVAERLDRLVAAAGEE
jgi:uncharacterized protein with HEPN domain